MLFANFYHSVLLMDLAICGSLAIAFLFPFTTLTWHKNLHYVGACLNGFVAFLSVCFLLCARQLIQKEMYSHCSFKCLAWTRLILALSLILYIFIAVTFFLYKALSSDSQVSNNAMVGSLVFYCIIKSVYGFQIHYSLQLRKFSRINQS